MSNRPGLAPAIVVKRSIEHSENVNLGYLQTSMPLLGQTEELDQHSRVDQDICFFKNIVSLLIYRREFCRLTVPD